MKFMMGWASSYIMYKVTASEVIPMAANMEYRCIEFAQDYDTQETTNETKW